MTTRTITYQICDGCQRTTLDDEIDIVDGLEIINTWDARHICDVCASEKYLCRHCRKVHGYDDLCDPVRAMQEGAGANGAYAYYHELGQPPRPFSSLELDAAKAAAGGMR